MKKAALLSTMAFLLLLMANAQNFPLPEHPMDPQMGNKPQLLIKEQGYSDSMNLLYPGVTRHKYSPDGYIDTVDVGMHNFVEYYSKETNKLIRKDAYGSLDRPKSSSHTFEYDAEGRQVKLKSTSYRYDLEDNLIEKEDTVNFDYDFSQVQYTDSGYIFNGSEYIFDTQKRLKRVYHPQDNLWVDYAYFDNGTGYSKCVYSIIPVEAVRDWYQKEEFFFDEKGLLSKQKTYRRFYDETEWKLTYNEIFTYSFYDSTITSVTPPEVAHRIYGTEGGLRIEGSQPGWVSVYSVSGQLVRKLWVETGWSDISLPKGLYFVRFENESFKVVVR